jgi:hypothetical protein
MSSEFLAGESAGLIGGDGGLSQTDRAQTAPRTLDTPIFSKSMRRTSAGEIAFPHFGQIVSRDTRTFFRSIFRDLGMSGSL